MKFKIEKMKYKADPPVFELCCFHGCRHTQQKSCLHCGEEEEENKKGEKEEEKMEEKKKAEKKKER